MPIANLTHALEVSRRRRQRAAGCTADSLSNERDDTVAADALKRLFNLLGQAFAVLLR